MKDLRELNQAVQNATFPSVQFAQCVRDWIEEATEMMEPASEEPFCRYCTGYEVAMGERQHSYTCMRPQSEPAALKGMAGVCYSIDGEPVDEGANVECPHCGEATSFADEHKVWPGTRTSGGVGVFTCKPAQPEPAAPEAPAERAGNGDVQGEMPEAVKMAIYQLRQNVRLWQLYGEQPASEVDRKAADALESWWRSRTQPVGITEELESVLRSAKEYEMAVRTGTRVEWNAYDADRIGAAIAAVRSQYGRKG